MLSESNYNALKKYRGGLHTGPKITDEIRYFRDQKYIDASSYKTTEDIDGYSINPTAWKLTPLGEDALAEFEYIHNKDAQDERRQRFDRKMQILNIAIPLITFIAGLLAEHFSGIVSWIVSLF